jgi:hypothetical protein
MGQWLDFKRNMVVFGRSGNPDGIHLQTVGIPKAVANRTVPNIVGMTYPNAQAALTAVGLSMDANIKQPSGVTNLLLWTEQFDNAAWTKIGTTTVTPNAITAPDGTLTADSANIPTGSGIYQTITSVGASNSTVSIYLKADSNSTIRLLSNNNLSEIFSVICNVTNYWQRFTVSYNRTAGTTIQNLQLDNSSGGIFHVWGAQLEVGSPASPYIKNEGTTNVQPVVLSQSPAAGAVVPKTYSVIANFAVVLSVAFSNGFQQIGFF